MINTTFSNHLEHYLSTNKRTGELTSSMKAVQEVMSMNSVRVKKLLKGMFDVSVEVPGNVWLNRLAAAYLVQIEVKHRISDGESFLPFNLKDYNEAMEYAQANSHKYIKFDTVEDENGEEIVVEKKRGRRKGSGSFPKVEAFVNENPELLDKSYDAKDGAKLIVENLGIKEATALQYLYKCRRLHQKTEAA